MFLKNNSKNAVYALSLIFINLYLFSKLTLLYDITESPDFNIYKQYVYYFFGLSEQSKLDNGSIYFYLVSLFLSTYEGSYVGNNYLIIFNNAVHLLNFLLSLLALTGIYFYFQKKGYKKDSILISLILLSFFSPFLQIKLTMKPEILTFALLPFLMIAIENYFEFNKIPDLLISVFLFSIISSSRGSIFVIVSLFLIFYYLEDIKSIKIKKILAIFLLSILVLAPIVYQDYEINGYTLFSNSETRQNYSPGDYNNRANPLILFNINFVDLGARPYLNNHADSFIGITLLDTFNDYFHLYWNRDKSLINQNQRIKNIYDENFYVNKFFKNFEYYITIFFSGAFYFFLIKIYKRNKNLKLLIAPFIGMLLIVVNSFGIPFNNFDPLKADTYKTFYYSFLLCFSFVQLALYVLNLDRFKNNFKKYLTFFIYILSVLMFLGFPKFYTANMYESMSNQNGFSPLCSINLQIDKNLKTDNCFPNDINYCGWSNNYQKPEVNEDGMINYFKDDKFGLVVLSKDSDVRIVEGFAECYELQSYGYDFYIQNENLRILQTTNLYIFTIVLFYIYKFFVFFRSRRVS